MVFDHKLLFVGERFLEVTAEQFLVALVLLAVHGHLLRRSQMRALFMP
jgi:hypothetical protein